LDEIIQLLTKNTYIFSQTISINWVYKNLDNIRDEIFESNFKDFLLQFDTWKKYFPKNITEENVFELGTDIIDLAKHRDDHNYECIKHYFEVAIENFSNSKKEEWLDNFETQSNFIYAFNSFFEYNLIDKSITKGKPFMEAYEEFLKEVAKRNKTLPDNTEIWNKLVTNNLLDNRKLTRLYNDLLDFLINHTEITSQEIMFFSYGLFKHSSNIFNNENKADEFIRKVLIPLDNNLSLLSQLITNYLEEIINLIFSSSGTYSQDLSELFTFSKGSDSINSDLIDQIFKETELKEIVKSKEDSEKSTE
jgi:hypothetical protein